MRSAKRIVCSLLAAILVMATLAVHPAAQAQSISYTNSVTVFEGPGTTYLTLGKFDSGLGTLAGVELKINFSGVGGSFTVTNTSGTVAVTSAVMNASIFGFGIASWTTNDFNLASIPALPFSGIAEGSQQIFAVTAGNIWTNEIQNVSSTFWSDYEAPGGGTVSFPVFNNSEVFLTASDVATADSGGISLETEMVVTYTFVPEPSTYALLLAGGAVSLWALRRRKHAKLG